MVAKKLSAKKTRQVRSGSGSARQAQIKKSTKKAVLPKASSVVPRTKGDGQIPRTKIRVIGIGGGGGNIVTEISRRVQRADFVVANTDVQSLKELPRKVRALSFGYELTRGLGCGMDPAVGKQAAIAETERVKKLCEGQDICVFIVSLGGGTGSGAIPVFAEAAKDSKCLSVGIFTLPFSFEGEKRKQIAKEALEAACPFLNAYCVMPNDKVFSFVEKNASLQESLSAVNTKVAQSLEGLIETIASPGLINVDFADIRSVLEGRGRLAFLHFASASGASRAQDVSRDILANPLYEYSIAGAERILFSITGDKGMKMPEVAEISRTIAEHNPRARVIFGISCKGSSRNGLCVTLLAVGCGEEGKKEEKKKKPVAKKPSVPNPVEKKKEENSAPSKKKPEEKKKPALVLQDQKKEEQLLRQEEKQEEQILVRRNGLDVKRETDREIQEMEEQEKELDVPAFLRKQNIS
ncbi:MAG: cell division protein FtsZ [bacterium]|nr:cell division protein FtsZ [bacterium]